jgi:hypothetical protein
VRRGGLRSFFLLGRLGLRGLVVVLLVLLFLFPLHLVLPFLFLFLFLFFLFLLFLELFEDALLMDAGGGLQEELAEIAEDGGSARVGTAVDEFKDNVAEELVDGSLGVEIARDAGGETAAARAVLRSVAAGTRRGVMRAERGMAVGARRLATATCGIGVLTAVAGAGGGHRGSSFRRFEDRGETFVRD